uniref:Nucleotide-diphospho-sugar transferase domain-containing protein n=1 Tax=Chromera velia CCMP2878 TaxID=1169474 RepID=A0A0G4HQG2_9ALVE|eukprot:Cvel_1256.t1-p1 / transcript=Cvel_1256.t1 / gene=Cvel_1256 / organism=Chromera_velia_CCMP2878 / gene_product=Glycogenin-1, putative / transcript_product=Glycogenin-1, putative / location=Cvel_scaffold42:47166-49544(-) / protein_length=671 / sequence_SO=supercontig / SO=protein_coding / is_pseudo=false
MARIVLNKRVFRIGLVRVLLCLGALVVVGVSVYALVRLLTKTPDECEGEKAVDRQSLQEIDNVIGQRPNIIFSSVKSMEEDFAFATFVSSPSYLPALEVFVESLAMTRPRYPLHIFQVTHGEDWGKKVIALARRYEGKLQIQVEGWEQIRPPRCTRQHPRWAVNYTKMRLWQMERVKAVLFLDADTLILRPLDFIFRFAGALDGATKPFLGSGDWGKWAPPSSWKMNGGVFLFAPGVETFRRLLTIAADHRKFRSEEAEQGIFNSVFRGLCCLPNVANVQKTVMRHEPSLWSWKDIAVLHFVQEKPWTSWSHNSFRDTFVREDDIEKQRYTDLWDQSEYSFVHNLWKREFLQGRLQEKGGTLTMFQAYQSPEDWLPLESAQLGEGAMPARLSGRLRAPSDFDVLAHVPPLSHEGLRSSLGLWGVMKAVLKGRKGGAWVGFMSASDEKLEEGPLGASIAWTKVDLDLGQGGAWGNGTNLIGEGEGGNLRVLYFWVGRCDDSLRSVIRGEGSLGRVLFETLGSLGGFAPLDLLGKRDKGECLAGGGRLILPWKLFVEMMSAVGPLVDRFLFMHPEAALGSCPFAASYVAGSGGSVGLGCTETLVEALINVWALKEGVDMVFAVDHPLWRVHGPPPESLQKEHGVPATERTVQQAGQQGWIHPRGLTYGMGRKR